MTQVIDTVLERVSAWPRLAMGSFKADEKTNQQRAASELTYLWKVNKGVVRSRKR